MNIYHPSIWILFLFLFFSLFLNCTKLFAEDNFYIHKFHLICGRECENYHDYLAGFGEGEYSTESLKLMAKTFAEENVESLRFSVEQNQNGKNFVTFQVDFRTEITDVVYVIDGLEYKFEPEDEKILYFNNDESVQKLRQEVLRELEEDGYAKLQLQLQVQSISKENGVRLRFIVEKYSKTKIKELQLEMPEYKFSSSIFKLSNLDTNLFLSMKDAFKDVINLYGASYNEVGLQVALDKVKRNLWKKGYLNFQLSNPEAIEKGNDVILKLKLLLGDQYLVDIRGILSTDILKYKEKARVALQKYGANSNSHDTIALMLREYDVRDGFFQTEYSISHRTQHLFNGSKKFFYFITRGKSKKIKISHFNFTPASFPLNHDIQNFYWESGEDLTKSGFVSPSDMASFKEKLKIFLVEKGYIFAEIKDVDLEIDKNELLMAKYPQATIVIDMVPGQKITVGSIKVTTDFSDNHLLENEDVLKSRLRNQESKAYNPLAVKADLEEILKYYQNEGHFYAQFKTTSPQDLILYNSAQNQVHLTYPLVIGKKIKVSYIRFSGNIKTKPSILDKMHSMKIGDYLTLEKKNKLQEEFLASGMFSSVHVSEVLLDSESSSTQGVELVVHLKERKRMSFEMTPGYRTDMGAKIAGNFNYYNLMGEAKTLGAKLQLNRRFEEDDVDSERRPYVSPIFEYRLETFLRNPYSLTAVFDHPLTNEIKVSVARQRFSSFDAQMYEFSTELSRSYWEDKITLAARYQFENIIQYNALSDLYRGNFRIGGMIPSFTLDLRDRTVLTTKGFLMSLTWEFANPYFLSMKESDLEINYHKLVARNYFYFPMGIHGTLALLLGAGVEVNNAVEPLYNADGSRATFDDETPKTLGYIPSFKVFKLDGAYNVRGFTAEEINRTDDGQNVDLAIVSGNAFFSNIKLEPRFYLTDYMILSPFLDAGGIYLDSFKISKMRTSTGLSFKFVTPVGSLDFDYGVKLQRRHYDNKKEQFGRFHLSIGMF